MTISATDILVPACSKTPLLYLLTQKVAQKFGYVLGIKKEVSLAFVAPSTVSVSTKIKVFGFAKSIGVELCVEKIDCSNLHIAYSGKLGVELLITPAIAFLKRLLPDKTNFITQNSNNRVIVNLAEIEKLKGVLEKVTLKSICFDEEHVVIESSLNIPN